MGGALSSQSSTDIVKNAIKTVVTTDVTDDTAAVATAREITTINLTNIHNSGTFKFDLNQTIKGDLKARMTMIANSLSTSDLNAKITAAIDQETKGQVLGGSADFKSSDIYQEQINALSSALTANFRSSCVNNIGEEVDLDVSGFFNSGYAEFDSDQILSYKLDCIFDNTATNQAVATLAATIDDHVKQSTTYNDLMGMLAMVLGIGALIIFGPEIMASNALKKAWADPIGKLLVISLLFGLWFLYLGADCGGSIPLFNIPFLHWGFPPSICGKYTKYPLYIGSGVLCAVALVIAYTGQTDNNPGTLL